MAVSFLNTSCKTHKFDITLCLKEEEKKKSDNILFLFSALDKTWSVQVHFSAYMLSWKDFLSVRIKDTRRAYYSICEGGQEQIHSNH